MDRRRLLQATTAGAATALAGCGGLLGGGSCGPGPDEIGTLAQTVGSGSGDGGDGSGGDGGDGTSTDEEPSEIVGAIQSFEGGDGSGRAEAIVVDDGTGTARLTTLGGGFRTQNLVTGDCARATGFALPGDGNVDIEFLVETVGLAN